jgi:RNA polymerase sigma factor (sigma-70 family)
LTNENPPSDPAEASSEKEASTIVEVPRHDLMGRLFQEHNDALINLLKSRLGSHHEAKDVAQEAYVKMLGLTDPGTVSYLRSYLFKTAINIANNRVRDEKARRRIDQMVFFETPIEHRSPESTWVQRQELALMRRALEELPADCRRAFHLVKFDDLTFKDAAAQLDTSPMQVWRLVARALAHLEQVLMEANLVQGDPP